MRSLAVASALFGEEPTFLGCLVRGRERAARNEFIEDREREARDGRSQGGHAQQPMHGKDDSQIDRREGHVEQGEGSRPGNELPHGHKIADRLATDAGRTAQAMGHHGIEDPSPQRLVHPAADPADNALADVIQGSVEGIKHGQEDGQGYKRGNAVAGQHAIIDLEHEKRAGKHQKVDDQAEDSRGYKGRPAGPYCRLNL